MGSKEKLFNKSGQEVSRETFVENALLKNERRARAEEVLIEAFKKHPDGLPQPADTELAFNCQQLSLACFFIARSMFPKADDNWTECVWKAHLQKTDHVFCVLGKGFSKFHGFSISQMKEFFSSELTDVYVVDVWLNTWCGMADYWQAVHTKLDRWASRGKRVAWTGGFFFPANGDYRTSFLTEGMDIQPAP